MPYRTCPDCGIEYHARGPRDAPGVRVCEHAEEKLADNCTYQPKEEPVPTKFLAFDLEISKCVPDGETDWKAYRPLGISCFAVAWVEGRKVTASADHGADLNGNPASQMSRSDCIGIVETLQHFVNLGHTILTHNGCSFDFDVLAEESGLHAECRELAMNSVDTCFLVHCLKGFPVGLEAIARGMKLQGKTDGMNGALAPQMWAEGKYAEVLEYVQQDVRATLNVAIEIESIGGLYWIAKSGRRNWLHLPKLLTVREAMRLPEPDIRWMTEPIPRAKFTAWMEGAK